LGESVNVVQVQSRLALIVGHLEEAYPLVEVGAEDRDHVDTDQTVSSYLGVTSLVGRTMTVNPTISVDTPDSFDLECLRSSRN
jgi:hypothetical protein